VCRVRGPVRRPSVSVVTIASKMPTLPLRGRLRCAHLAHHGYSELDRPCGPDRTVTISLFSNGTTRALWQPSRSSRLICGDSRH
jgi:hypothetical protein